MKNVPEKYKQGQEWANANYITAIEVEQTYGVSRQQQRNLYMKGTPPDALYIGATLLYWRSTAEPFFRDYDKRQKDRIASSEERKDKRRPGRPKKNKVEDWRNTMLGNWNIIIGEEFTSPEAWLRDLSTRMSIHFRDKLGTDEHNEWLEKRKELRAHFGILEKNYD